MGELPSVLVRRIFGAPVAGVNEVQTMTIAGGPPSSGTFSLGFRGFTTGPISWNANNTTLLASINTALQALPTVGSGNLVATAGTLTAGIGTILLTAAGKLAGLAIPTVTVASNTLSPATTISIAKTTTGVTATERDAIRGAILVSDNGNDYRNSQPTAGLPPIWTAL